MRTLITALLDAGALGLLFVAYLALTGRQEVRQELSIDKIHFEQEAARFDQSFEQKWQAFGGQLPASARSETYEPRTRDPQTKHRQASEKLEESQPANEKELAEMKATLDAADKNR